MTLERSLPANIEAEKGVLGSIIIDPSALVQVASFLFPEDFYRDRHRVLYEAILALDGRNEPADSITICDELTRRGKLDEGDDFYILSLINEVPTSGNAEYYGRIVERASVLRRIIAAAGQIVAKAYEPDADARDTLIFSEALLRAIANNRRGGRAEDYADLATRYLTRLEQLAQISERGVVTGIPTGFTRLDRLTGGLQRSDLIILAGRPGQGKSALVFTLANNVVKQFSEAGYKTLVYSLEMSKAQVVQRLLSHDTGIDQTRLRIGALDEARDEWQKVVDAVDDIPAGALWIDDEGGLDILEIRNRARRHQAEFGLDLLVVDYLQLGHAHKRDGKSYENRQEEVAQISRDLKALARELDIPVIALAQLSRAVEGRANKVPQLSDLRESGAIEQDADIVMFLHEEPEIEKMPDGARPINLIIAKHRNGAMASLPLRFYPELTLFRDMPAQFVAGTEESIEEEEEETTGTISQFPSRPRRPVRPWNAGESEEE